jgi:predicted transcriptional regulator
MTAGDGTLSTEAHRILRIYEMFFALMFRFMEEYGVKDLGNLMIITTVSIANSNKIDADIETISEETDIPYSTVRRKVDKLCEDGILVSRKEAGRICFSISDDVGFAHPDQKDLDVNNLFQNDVLDAVVKSLTAIILEKSK